MISSIILTSYVAGQTENDCAPNDGSLTIVTQTQAPIEEDCAPADSPLRDRPDRFFKPVNSNFTLTPQLYTNFLPRDFTLAYSPFSPAGPAVLNQQAVRRLYEFSTPQPLDQAVDYTLAQGGLLVAAGQKPTLTRGHPLTLTAWLHITNACNLDCPYCYVRKSNEHMSEEIGLKAVEAVFRSAEKNGFKAVKLKYAGGEAALHFKLVQRLHRYAQHLAAKKGLDLRAVVLSNGTVWTAAMARWLVDSGVKLMISLDGVGAAHDAQRPDRGGRGSFARIEHTVDHILLPAGVRPDISITITGRNAFAAADAVAWGIERDLPFSLNFYRENLLSASYHDLKLEEQQIIEGMRRAYQVVEKYLPTRPFLGGLLDRVQAEAHTHTCGVGQSYMVFTHTGQVAQCQMHLGEGKPLNGAHDPLELVAHGSIPVISVDDKEGCRECAWRYRCAGGCPLETYRAAGRFDVQSPHCSIYRALFPEALKLEGLRLMRLEGYLS
ncbi:MAG: SPASM domain-containing protein [Anaerolineales bacterium]|nr:SPASM domain-containing protein [Anaerolineales bacterium]